jgi:hypothetical protein
MRYDTTRRLTLHYAGHYRGEDRSSNRKENRERGRRRQRIVGAARRLRPPVRRGDVRDQRSLVEAANNSNAASSTSFAGDGTGVYEVGGPADPHRRRPDRDRQTQGPGVVGEDDRVPAQQPSGPPPRGRRPQRSRASCDMPFATEEIKARPSSIPTTATLAPASVRASPMTANFSAGHRRRPPPAPGWRTRAAARSPVPAPGSRRGPAPSPRGAVPGSRRLHRRAPRPSNASRVLRLLVEVGHRAVEGRQGRSSVLSRRMPGHRRNLLILKLRAKVIEKRVPASDSCYASRGRHGRETRNVQRTPHRRGVFPCFSRC